MQQRPVIVLTGGPGGGKTPLIDDLRRDPAWTNRFVTLPETIFYATQTNISVKEQLFQRVMVNLQIALEDGLQRALDPADPRVIICHRGSLDPLAYWLRCGWTEEEFFAFTNTTREAHYQRYTAVIQLVTAADGAPEAYTRWPQAHRPEEAEDAIWLDRWLEQVWRGHPHYFRLDNDRRNWPEKSAEARRILANLIRRET
jgi:predicted ATPase